jgi:hypothetical protein
LTDNDILREELLEECMSESRLDFLEGRVEEQSRNWERLFADIGRVDQKIDALGLGLSARIDTSFGQFTAEIARLDQKIDRKIDGLRAELATHGALWRRSSSIAAGRAKACGQG